LTITELSKKLNEKESVLKKIEANLMEPNEEVLKKIESFLGVNLRQVYEEKFERKSEKKRPKLTLGDVVKVK